MQQTEAETTIRAYSAITSGNINAVPTIGTPSASVLTLCNALQISLQGGVTTSAEYTGTNAVAKKTTDTATNNYNCSLLTSATTRTTTSVVISSQVIVTSTEAKITAWETNLTNLGYTTSGAVTLKDDTAYAYFGRADMNYIPKTKYSASTGLGKANTALTGDLSLAGSVFAAAAALYTTLAF